MKVVAVLAGDPLPEVWSAEFIARLKNLGEFTLVERGGGLADDEVVELVGGHDVALVGWDARALPAQLAAHPGRLRYVCSYAGSIRGVVPKEFIEAGIMVSNWGDLPAATVAEGALALLMAVAHQVPQALESQRSGKWGFDGSLSTRIAGLAVGVYGCGSIGLRFVEMLLALDARVRVYDPYVVQLPEGVGRSDSLDELCAWSEALVVHAGLSAETERSVGAAQLAALADHAIVINTARGAIVDQDALVEQARRGRLRLGLDVLEPDELAPDHPLRTAPNVILGFHQIAAANWPDRGIDEKAVRVLEQLTRFADGREPLWLFDVDRYERST